MPFQVGSGAQNELNGAGALTQASEQRIWHPKAPMTGQLLSISSLATLAIEKKMRCRSSTQNQSQHWSMCMAAPSQGDRSCKALTWENGANSSFSDPQTPNEKCGLTSKWTFRRTTVVPLDAYLPSCLPSQSQVTPTIQAASIEFASVGSVFNRDGEDPGSSRSPASCLLALLRPLL